MNARRSIAYGLLMMLLTVGGLTARAAEVREVDVPAGLLFYASFDGDGYESLDPADYTQGAPGAHVARPGQYPQAEHATGNPSPVNINRVTHRDDGRFGGAVHVPANGVLGFEALGNIQTRRGTLAFWISPEDDLWSKPYRGGRHPHMVMVTVSQWPFRYHEFIESGVNSIVQRIQLHGYDRWHWRPEAEWPARSWHHIAITWHAGTGKKLYHNGELVAVNEMPDHRFPRLDQIGLASQAYPHQRINQALGFSFDELYVFDYQLEPEQIRTLMEENRPPQTRSPLAAEDADAEAQWLRKHFSLDDAGVPEVPTQGLRATRVHVAQALDVKMATFLPVDGKMETFWPTQYKGYSTSGQHLRVRLADDEPTFDFVRLRGSRFDFALDLDGVHTHQFRTRGGFAGRVEADDAAWTASFTGHDLVQRLSLDKPLTTTALTFTHGNGVINHVDLYRLEPLSRDDLVADDHRWTLSGGASPAEAGDAGRHIRDYFPLEDQHVLLGEATGGTALHDVQPYRAMHIVSPPLPADTAVDRLLLDLQVQGFTGPTRMVVQWFDPVTWNRHLAELEVQFTGRGERQPVRLLLDRQDVPLEAGRQLWLAVFFDQPGELVLGPEGSALAVAGDLKQVGRDYIRGMERIASDLFLFLSESRPWYANANGTDPMRQTSGVGELMTVCEHVLHFDPGNRTAAGLYSWILRFRDRWDPAVAARYTDPLEAMELPDPQKEGPDWAVYGREALKASRTYVDWWVNERQLKTTGELGSNIGDDTTLMPGFVNFALINDPDHRLRKAVRLLADHTWDETLHDGIAKVLRDHLHVYEEGTNIQHLLPRLYYGNPEYITRMMITSRAYEDHLTGINPQGFRLMRNHDFSATVMPGSDNPARYKPWDAGFAMIFMPGRILGWYNANPAVLRVLSEWQDSWLHFSRGRPDREFFGLGDIMFQTGERRGNHRVTSGMWEHLFWLYELTGEERYREPVVMNLRAGFNQARFSREQWVDWRALKPDKQVDEALRTHKRGPGWLQWQIGGDRQLFIEDLKQDILDARKYLPVHTWVGQSTDRVSIPQNNMARMYLGGLASVAKRLDYHFHAVSWESADDDVARFVVEKSRQHLKVLIYNFHDQPQEIVMRVWQLEPGRYSVRAGSDVSGDEQIDSVWREWDQALWRYEPVKLTVPPRQVFVVEVDQQQRYDWRVQDLPDLAIGPRDVRVEGDEIAVTVHNIGGADAPTSEVQLVRGDTVVARQTLPPLPAPLDLQPKTHEVRFPGIRHTAGLEVVVDPQQRIRQITHVNDRLPLDGQR